MQLKTKRKGLHLMKKIALCIIFATITTLFVGCESDDTVYINTDSSTTQSTSIAGVWHGISASSQVSTTLNLSDYNGSISGSLKWPNDHRSVSGFRSGKSITLYISGGDVWHMTLSGNNLFGKGDKAGTTRSYNLSFSR